MGKRLTRVAVTTFCKQRILSRGFWAAHFSSTRHVRAILKSSQCWVRAILAVICIRSTNAIVPAYYHKQFINKCYLQKLRVFRRLITNLVLCNYISGTMIIIDCCSVFDFTLSKFALEIIKSDDGTCRRYNSPASVGCTGYPGVSVALVCHCVGYPGYGTCTSTTHHDRYFSSRSFNVPKKCS